MSAATVTALCTGIAGVVTAVAALVKVLTHTHQPPQDGGTP